MRAFHPAEAPGQDIERTNYISKFRYQGRRSEKNNPYVWVNIFPLLGGDFTQGIAGCITRAFLNNYSSFKLMSYIPAPFGGDLACLLNDIHNFICPFWRGVPPDSGTKKNAPCRWIKGEC
jgi:hypothetical protein